MAVAGFLARYRGSTRTGYRTDLRCWSPGAPSTTWPCSTLAGLYRFALIDGHLLHSPAEHVRRPKPGYESTTLGLDRMELGAFLAQAAASSPADHALGCLLGLLGLRVSQACNVTSSILGQSAGIARSR